MAIFKMPPNSDDETPDEYGDLILDDTVNKLVIPGCKLMSLKSHQDESGEYWILEIADRRWKWRDLGYINGVYNQLDNSGKLLPWTVRSPFELALLCLDAMNETKWQIDLPDGLTQADGEKFAEKLRAGQLFPPSGTNPPVEWTAESPATALQNLASMFGRRVIYRPTDDFVSIEIPGRGKELPLGSISRLSPGVDSPARPGLVGVYGSPTRYTARLGLEPVGQEWDGSYRPIDLLSYAPIGNAAVQVTTVTLTGFAGLSPSYKVYVNDVINAHILAGGDTATTVMADLAAKINANAAINTIVTATAALGVLTLTGKTPGVSFAVRTDAPIAPELFTIVLTQSPMVKGATWLFSPPPFQAGPGNVAVGAVRGTAQLSWIDALNLARKTVWKCYRIIDVDLVGDGKQPIKIPGYGKLKRRQQIVLQDTQPDQVTPQPQDTELKSRNNAPFTLNLYNGFSRDKPAAIYGAAYVNSAYALVVPIAGNNKGNTNPGDQYLASVHIDPYEQLVIFDQPVFFLDSPNTVGHFQKPNLVLQTGVLIRDGDTNQLDAYVAFRGLDNPSDPATEFVQKFPDIQRNWVATFDTNNNVTNLQELEDDAKLRAQYYLDGMVQQFPDIDAETREYNGLLRIDMDGAIQQVTISIGADGISTTVSRGSEHSIWIAPYPARRRAEALPSIPEQAIQRIGIRIATGGDIGGPRK